MIVLLCRSATDWPSLWLSGNMSRNRAVPMGESYSTSTSDILKEPYPEKRKNVATLSDDELRPWIINEAFDTQIDEKITELNKLMTSCLPQKSGGGRGESILDRPPDSLILLSDMVQNENWIYDGEESVASEEDLENEEKEKEENHSPETVAQDPEIIELTTKLSSLNNRKNLDELEDEDDRMARYALHLAKKRRRKKLRSAAYMPNLKSKMYKEWLETQFAKSLSAPSDVWRREDDARPSTANISSFFAQQGINDEEYFGMRPMTSSSSVSRLQSPPSPIRLLAPLEESQVAGKDSLQRPQTQCSSRPHTQSQQLQMSSSVSTLPSPIATPPSSHGNRPFTSSSRPLTRSGLETITPPSVVFPTSNTDTIPSSNSAIVKYKTSRDYMLDTLALPSKEQRDKALKRSIERGSPLPLKGSQQQTQTQPTRYDTKANPLAKIAIAPDKGTAVSTTQVYQKHQIRKVRTLRDKMMTSTGSATLFTTDGHNLPPDVLDPVRAHHTTLLASKRTREINEEDHTGDLLKTPGFLENIGPNNFYMTNNKSVFTYPENKFTEALLNRDTPSVTKPDLIKVWAEDALSHGRKLFCYGGGGFHFAK